MGLPTLLTMHWRVECTKTTKTNDTHIVFKTTLSVLNECLNVYVHFLQFANRERRFGMCKRAIKHEDNNEQQCQRLYCGVLTLARRKAHCCVSLEHQGGTPLQALAYDLQSSCIMHMCAIFLAPERESEGRNASEMKSTNVHTNKCMPCPFL